MTRHIDEHGVITEGLSGADMGIEDGLPAEIEAA